jgi:transposase InsO family protein
VFSSALGSRNDWYFDLGASDHLQEFVALAETQTSKKVRVIRLDNAPEYRSKELREWAAEKRIILQFTTIYTHQQITIAKQGNRTILNTVKSILNDSRLLLKYWEFATAYYIYIWNRTWSLILEKTPYKE